MPATESSTSLGLLQAVQADERYAWEQLRQLYAPLVLHWCKRSGLSLHDAEDLTQDVFAAVHKGLENYNHQSKFRAWLHTITINKIRDFARSSKLRPHAIGGSDAASDFAKVAFPIGSAPSRQEDEDILVEQVLRLLKQSVSQTTWLAFWRTTVEHAPSSVVGEELGISKGAVRQAKHRMLQRLREEFLNLEIQTDEKP